MQLVVPYLKLMRPANIVTAFSDILAGAAIVTGALTAVKSPEIWLLLLSTAGLYGGGVVLNDYFDADLDKIERPERPIPSGQVKLKYALFLGVSLFCLGIAAALLVNMTAGIIAFIISLFAVFYDAKGKHLDYFGPINMGMCRGMNLLLGMSMFPSILLSYWYLLFIPLIYIAAITSISKGEVHGSGKQPLYLAAFFYLLIFGVIIFLGISNGKFLNTLPFALLFLILVLPQLIKAIKIPSPIRIRSAVKAGIIALIALNAAIATSFAGLYFGLVILLLLPFSIVIAKSFTVS